jgi:hypothetical protein
MIDNLGITVDASWLAEAKAMVAEQEAVMGRNGEQLRHDLANGLGRRAVYIIDNLGVTGDTARAWIAHYEATGLVHDDALALVGTTQEEMAPLLAEVERVRATMDWLLGRLLGRH